jgi:serine/threonine protein kinase
LYCHQGNLWKLTDFGISAPALSKGVTTVLMRGTPCYRAPELFKEVARFTDKIDLCALGCILYELATGSRAFKGDYDIAEYSRGGGSRVSIPLPSKFWRDHVTEVVQALPDKEESQRP